MSEPQVPSSLLTLIVTSPASLVALGTGQLPEGARCIVQEGTGTLPDNRTYIFTKKAPTAAITFTNGVAPNDNVIQSSTTGLWVAETQLVKLTLNGTTPVVVADLYCASSDSTTLNTITFFSRSGAVATTSVSVNYPDDASISVVAAVADTAVLTMGIQASI